MKGIVVATVGTRSWRAVMVLTERRDYTVMDLLEGSLELGDEVEGSLYRNWGPVDIVQPATGQKLKAYFLGSKLARKKAERRFEMICR